ncbi:MAG TPA: UDP-N-acetylmuramoyl-L-alanyl-D-glutamate--2,6-diaminopimelate ligase [Pseudoflavonifractor sp.]|nr:UDP-N-acetylmuramoyl-L-alanyl-D-glutamate--2,6-diaminopimelate ligase [Pseudoflavonifractor sp.]
MDRPRLPLGDYWQLLLKHGLLAVTEPLGVDLTRPVPMVSCDSRSVVPGALFLCKGAAFRSEYLRQASEKGAAAYVSEIPYPDVPELTGILVTDIRAAMALLADRAWGHPSGDIPITGITGTKGKTTAAYFLKSILDCHRQAEGKGPTAILSTIVTDDGVERRNATLTTPEPLDLQRHLWNAVSADAGFVTMEVSSQALKYRRVMGVELATAVFLNIGEDHISPIEHPDFEDYFSSKLAIFRQAAAACINLDCDHADRVRAAAAVCPRVLTFSKTDPSADIFADDLTAREGAVSFRVRTPGYTRRLRLPMSGLFNVDNALAAIAAAERYGIPEAAVAEGLSRAAVPGRMETYTSADGALSVIVDYAHNGMSLEALLSSVRAEYPLRQLTVLFGCTGGKGLDRREGMGHAAGRWADRIFLTEDDPGPEAVEAICDDIGRYIAPHGKTWTAIPDREKAISTAVLEAERPAVVVLAGKGAEQRQKRREGSVPCAPDGLLARKVLDKYDAR